MPNTTSFEFGAVVLVRFPFTDQTATKQRPAVVVSSRAYNEQRPDVILMAITSQVRASTAVGEVEVNDWQGAGLLKPSALKPIIATIEKDLIKRTLGHLGVGDRVRLTNCLRDMLGGA